MQDIYGFPDMDDVPSVLRNVLADDKARRAAQALTPEEAAAFANWTRVSAEAETRWLAELSGDDGLLGFEPPALPDSAWILHAMYEDLRRRPATPADADAEAGAGAGNGSAGDGDGDEGDETDWSVPPKPHWQRLRWSELAERVGDPVVEEGSYPDRYQLRSCRGKTHRSPDNVLWSTEGSLDWETWHQLLDVLIEYSPDGPDTRCLVHFCRNMFYYHVPTVLTGRLGDARDLYHHPDLMAYSPSNIWPEDRTWVTYTHFDLHGTKVAGPTPLIEALFNAPGLEALRLPWKP
ncbi:hypothetical protein [Streptomyces sp. WZ-12]|uniref:hypothetical protein n=1 Tax=Streptomyces sp. WZ-12 TaxID=3030210 RepID=UPI0023812DB5|nr:hypothetical protein [Streptomyces sp. WZ-12]